MHRPSPLESIFFRALEKPSDADRAAFLDEACVGNHELRNEVEQMLAAQTAASSFLESPAPGLDVSQFEPSVTERPGTIIGPYKLLEQIGEGGFGVVFMAEQTKLIQRKVALKIIKPGMDTKEVIARFEAERQALALMDHPNIAKVHDAGTTESGRPYFVMELVRGIPLTEFCDQHKLAIRERLELLVSVCQAVQHAHQKGVIHRDLKPGNVLVTMHDGQPVVKVIDFGVAKATGQKLTEKTLFTGLLQMIGTPIYMSPEQAELSNLDVDTRSDIYSLGVVLYELLTGTTPFDSQRLKEATFDELRRIIREEEPPRPSTRLSTLAQHDSSTITEKRNIDPRQLSKLFQGELDWIVMKCLEKDRNRRYETASALGADLEHYLRDEPVQACPPSKIYRLRKFARQYRGALITGSLVAAALIVGTAVSIWQALEATQAKRQSKANEQLAVKNAQRADAISDFLINAFRSPDPARDGRDVRMAELLDRAAKNVEEEFADDKRMQADLLNAIAKSYEGLGLYRDSVLLYGKVKGLRTSAQGPRDPGTIEAMDNYASAYESAGQFDKAIPLYQEVLQIQKERLAPDDPEMLATTTKLAWDYNKSGQTEKALALFQDVPRLVQTNIKMSGRVSVELPEIDGGSENEGGSKKAVAPLVENTFEHLDNAGPNRTNVLVTLNNLAKAFAEAGQVDQAIPLYQQTLKLMQEKLEPDDPMTLSCMYNLAMAFKVAGKFDQAIPLFEETLQRRKEKFGESDIVARTMTCVGATYGVAGNKEKQAELFGESLRITKALLSEDHPDTLWSIWQYGSCLCDAGRENEAVPLWEKALAKSRINPGIDHPTTLGLIRCLIEVYRANGQINKATALAEDTLKTVEAKQGPNSPVTVGAMRDLARVYEKAGRIDDVIELNKTRLDRIREANGPHDAHTLGALSDLADAYQAAGRLEEASPFCEELLRLTLSTLGPKDAKLIMAKTNLGQLKIAQGKYPEAERLLNEDLADLRAWLPSNDRGLASRIYSLALALTMQNKFGDAEPLAREAVKIREIVQPDNWGLPAARSVLGGDLLGQKKFAEAEPLLLSGEAGLQDREANIPAKQKYFLRLAIERLVHLYETTNQPDKVASWKEKLAEFDRRTAGKYLVTNPGNK
jgi:eukaryotic-like serine/threonine-protein kinase